MSGTPNPAVGAPPVGGNSPPVQLASQVAVGMSLADIAITFGQTRQIIDQATGHPGGAMAIEWLVTMSLPVPVARALNEALKLSLDEYEKRFGAIPADPKSRLNVIASPEQ